MLVDEVTINVKAGNGGKGGVAFNRNLMSLGPTGGAGGAGGNIFLEGVANLNALEHFRHQKDWEAENGGVGRGQFVDGKDGPDIFLPVPVGTVVKNLSSGLETEILKIGEKIIVARGGHGGKGNFHYRSATNRSPRQFGPGTPGESATLSLELRIIADVGLIGFPNAGKSSLLNTLTKAKSKVANYPFTTLEPNLGAYFDLILADIPGLIEGASTGKGLGHKFLRHIERTKVLFHLIASDSNDPVADYQTIREELKKHNPELLSKPEYVFLSKSDLISLEELNAKEKILTKKIKSPVSSFSIIDDESLIPLKKILAEIEKEKYEKN